MTAVYGPRVNVHPDRMGANRANQIPLIRYLILHTSEQSGAEDPDDAEDLARYLESPGDRPSSSKPSGRYGSSYHGITDTDRVLPAVPDTVVAFAAGGGNRYGLHLCLPVKAGQTRAQWLDVTSRPYIAQAARWIVDNATRHRIPLVKITASQMAAGSWGYADHATVSRAFAKSDHTDVGVHFPWDVLKADIDYLARVPVPEPPEEPDMPTPEYVTIGQQPPAELFELVGPFASYVPLPKWQALGTPAPTRVINRDDCIALTFVGGTPPAGYRGIFANA